jgi:hypothetical protein
MVNADVVNAKTSYFLRATFCELNRDSGRFLYFKNTFKYTGKFNLNHKTVHPAAPPAHGCAKNISNISAIAKIIHS